MSAKLVISGIQLGAHPGGKPARCVLQALNQMHTLQSRPEMLLSVSLHARAARVRVRVRVRVRGAVSRLQSACGPPATLPCGDCLSTACP